MTGIDWEAIFGAGPDRQPTQEASGDMRTFGRVVRDAYLGFESAGFTPAQSLKLTTTWMTAHLNAAFGAHNDEEN